MTSFDEWKAAFLARCSKDKNHMDNENYRECWEAAQKAVLDGMPSDEDIEKANYMHELDECATFNNGVQWLREEMRKRLGNK